MTTPGPLSAAAPTREALRGGHYLIVGGGLAGVLTALALGQSRRPARVTLLERDRTLGGNHTWSFHDGDLDGDGHRLLEGLVTHRWPRHEVRFPGFTRTLDTGYSTISSAEFAKVAQARLASQGVELRLGTRVAELGATFARLDDGTILDGDLVIDARGPERLPAGARAGYQKFAGLEVALAADGPWSTPILMDATVPQTGGYRFIYVLPFAPRRVLIEDTIYADDPYLDVGASEQAIHQYARQAGAPVVGVVRRELGVLPLPIAEHSSTSTADGPLAVGYRGGFFHPVTGYSLPLAVRLAQGIAGARNAEAARDAVAALAGTLASQQRFGRLLNRLTFEGLPPAARRGAFQRFYRLPVPTIARFYASRSTVADRARVLLGRPPAGISWRGLFGAPHHRLQGDPS